LKIEATKDEILAECGSAFGQIVERATEDQVGGFDAILTADGFVFPFCEKIKVLKCDRVMFYHPLAARP
jgi:hypothetical protein